MLSYQFIYELLQVLLAQVVALNIFTVQTDRRAIATDEWLRVKGCEDVYALGDCATMDQRKIMVCKPSSYLTNLMSEN